ncbi:MAG: energy-coupling factor transporter transmembrane protein EcfT [Candidatus Lokiarchaeota archaeon]|nr:energy-coupling factor transporter transmembrane protein EcfT [Candidatus Lokiarchaeota archaeon]
MIKIESYDELEINRRISITYKSKNNFIYDSNPLVKFILFLSNFFIIFLISNPYYLFIIFLNMTLIACLGKDIKKVFRFLKTSLYLGLAIFIINIILRNDGDTVLLTFPFEIPIYGTIKITLETIIFSFIMVFQLILVILIFSLINIFINPDDLMKVFMKLKIPYTISLILILSTRFFPLLLDDMEKIKDVARSRGLELDKGNWFIKIKNKILLILPLLTNSLERSIQVAEALESRAFRISKKRTFFKKIKVNYIGYFTLILNCIFILTMFYLIIFQGVGKYNPFPQYHHPYFNIFDFYILLYIISLNIIFILLLLSERKAN